MRNVGATLAVALATLVLVPRAAARDLSGATLYMIMVDRFSNGDPSNDPRGEMASPDRSDPRLYHGGDLAGITARLDYLSALGVGGLWITPIVEQDMELHRYGERGEVRVTSYHGYWARDFHRVNAAFGSMDDWRDLIVAAHGRGMAILLDHVVNHTAPLGQGEDGALYRDGEFLTDFTRGRGRWFHDEGGASHGGKVTLDDWEKKRLADLADLNTENPRVRRLLLDIGRTWAATGLDGFRLDTARHVPAGLIAAFDQGVRRVNPALLNFGEWSMGRHLPDHEMAAAAAWSRRTGVGIIDFRLCYRLREVLAEDGSFQRLASAVRDDGALPEPHLTPTCIDNHDMPRFLVHALESGHPPEVAQRRSELATQLLLTLRGLPVLYYGTEQHLHVDAAGRRGEPAGDPWNRPSMERWDQETPFFKTLARLVRLRREVPALARGGTRVLLADGDLWVHERRAGGSVALVALNRSGSTQTVQIGRSALPDGTYSRDQGGRRRVLGPAAVVRGGSAMVALGPWEMGLWVSAE